MKKIILAISAIVFIVLVVVICSPKTDLFPKNWYKNEEIFSEC